MTNFKIGILGPSEIAFRRFLPALVKSKNFVFAGVAYADAKEWIGEGASPANIQDIIAREKAKAQNFKDNFGGEIYSSYKQIIEDDEIDAIYVPLPPLLHYKWGKIVLNNKKHLFLEKPFTSSANNTHELTNLAQSLNLAVHENFAFIFHKQLDEIEKNLYQIGDIRLISARFGFPYRGESDFRYSKKMGGGALLDCGGYPIRLASHLLGQNVKISTSFLSPAKNHDVDVFGSATLVSKDKSFPVQISFGMDNSYKCELEIWGSNGVIYAPRIFTPTAEMETVIKLTTTKTESFLVEPDDQFLNSLEYFGCCIKDKDIRFINYNLINIQSKLMDRVKEGK